ncbi:MAG: hypothetical protein IPP08_11600 [Chlorobiota bacterium]|nr:MAG: hypothetical protein IPP08_11600 [Chlorobiota bacterium]
MRFTLFSNNTCFVFIVFIISSNFLFGQNNGGRSYSVFNIGDIQQSANSCGVSRAGIESSVSLPGSINSVNPALWSDLIAVTLQTSLMFEQYKVSDSKSSLYQNNTKLQNFSLGFPYYEKLGAGFCLAIRPYSIVSYVSQLKGLAPIDTFKTTSLTTTSGQGGISEIIVGSSIRPFKGLQLGIAGSRYFGEITKETNVDFPENSTINSAAYISHDYYTGIGLKLGAIINPLENLTLGFVLEPSSKLMKERTNVIIRFNGRIIDAGNTQYLEDASDTLAKITSDYQIPTKLTFGATYKIGRTGISSEVNLQDWSINNDVNSTSSNKIAIGFDYFANSSYNATGLDKLSFRLGAYKEKSYYKVLSEDINSIGFTFGTSIPLTKLTTLNSGMMLDLGFDIGSRGTTNKGLTEEIYGKLSLGLSLSEFWFIRTRK